VEDSQGLWNRVDLMAQHDRLSQLREWNEAYPHETLELEAWRQQMHAHVFRQAHEDIKAKTLPRLQERGVDVAKVEAALERLMAYPLALDSDFEQIQKALSALYEAVRNLDALAKAGLLPGMLVKEVVQAAGDLFRDVGVPPGQIPRPSGRPRQDFMYHCAQALVDALHPATPVYDIAAAMLTNLGFFVTADTLERRLRDRRAAGRLEEDPTDGP
jgi:hypothetical protein